MEDELFNIVSTARQEVLDQKTHAQKVLKEQKRKEHADAKHAYEVFKRTLAQLLGVKSYKVGTSSLISRNECLIIEDTGGRKFEIHYHKVLTPEGKHFGGGDCDYHVNAQWGTETWYTYSVGMNIGSVAQQLGRWLAQTETANSLKCK